MPIIEPLGQTVFPFKPNWATPFNESLEWKTDVITSFAGNEQRRSLRVTPRRSFEYQFGTAYSSAQRIENMIYASHSREFLLPVWSDACKLSEDAAAGQKVIRCAPLMYSFNSGDLAVIYADENNYEVFEVASFDVDQINSLGNLTATWSSGVRVFPLVIGHLPTTIPTQRLNDSVLVGTLTFNTRPGETYTFLPVEVASETYAGLEVLTRQPNWKDAISNDFTRDFMVADSGVGPVGYYSRSRHHQIVRPYQWLLRTREEVVTFRKFIQRMRGQAKTCWVPSWHNDFTLVTTSGISSDLTVVGDSFHTFVGLDTDRDRIMCRLFDGTVAYRQIVGTALSGGDTVLSLDATIDRATIKSISILLRCRIATDKVVIPWQTTGVATPQITFTTVPL